MFVGRQRELELLHTLTQKRTAGLAVITGRRRIGKSRLVEEFVASSKGYRGVFLSALSPDPGVTTAMQRQAFAEQLQSEIDLPPVESRSWTDLFQHLARNTARGRWIILLDEVSWMAAGAPDFLPKLKVAWDTHLRQNPHLILILCGSVSSWLDANVLSSTGFVGRVSLSLKLEELPVAECAKFWGSARSRVSAFDILKTLAVTGGVPRYLEEVIPRRPVDENIRRLCFTPEGLLFREFDQIFAALFDRRAPTYRKLVAALADGHAALQKIVSRADMKKGGVASAYLHDLALAGFIHRDFTWDLHSRSTSKLSRYRLKDNYLRFYLKYILPNRRKIEGGRLSEAPLSSLPAWDTTMGLQFENLVYQDRRFVWDRCGISPSQIEQEGPFFQTATRQRRGCQIDYLIQMRSGPLYVCEIKFSRGPIKRKVEDEVAQKISRLRRPKHCSAIPVLIHAGEVCDTVAHGEFFAHVVDFTEAITER